jgi:hypothetical protein
MEIKNLGLTSLSRSFYFVPLTFLLPAPSSAQNSPTKRRRGRRLERIYFIPTSFSEIDITDTVPVYLHEPGAQAQQRMKC